MRKLMNDNALLALVTVGLAFAAVATPSMAGTVYSWTTEDGTTSFTDDPKRIPAKYKNQVERRQLGKLQNYKQYTRSQVTHATPYEKRIEDRLERMRAPELPAVSAPPPGQQPVGVRYGVGIGARDNDQVSFPVDGSGEGFVTSEHRIRTRTSIATQDIQVTKQGDQVVSARISAPNQRGITDRVDRSTAELLDVLNSIDRR